MTINICSRSLFLTESAVCLHYCHVFVIGTLSSGNRMRWGGEENTSSSQQHLMWSPWLQRTQRNLEAVKIWGWTPSDWLAVTSQEKLKSKTSHDTVCLQEMKNMWGAIQTGITYRRKHLFFMLTLRRKIWKNTWRQLTLIAPEQKEMWMFVA